jgi:hypothetical protein
MKTIVNYAKNFQKKGISVVYSYFSDPEQDPYVFEPPGSGAVIICTNPDPDTSISCQKKN